MTGAAAEAYRDEISRRTRRGLEGRARAAQPTGGRTYGYVAGKDSPSGQMAAREEKQAAKILRMLPRTAEATRGRLKTGNLGLKDPRSIIQGRNTLFGLFNGRVPMRPAALKPGERPYLIARVGINRDVLLQAAASAVGCRKS